MSKDQALVREFVFRDRADWDRFVAFMGANLAPMAEAKRYLRCVVSEYKATRSTEANAYMWAGILEPTAQQAYVAGQRYTAEVWHEHAKELFLPEINARGQEKWYYPPELPNPKMAALLQPPQKQRRLVMSTSHLNTAEMALYLDQVAEYVTTELGVLLPQNPRDR